MDRNSIATQARLMETKADLLRLLNQMKWDEMEREGMADRYHPFTTTNINYYCNPNHTELRYRTFKIPKRSGGSRVITAPRNKTFKLLLRYVNEIFKALYTPSPHAMGFTEGRSVVTNADLHRGQIYVFNIDLQDFFPSIHQARVWKRIQLDPLGLKRPIANILAGLCAMRVDLADGDVQYVLPQGAPTSPILSNMICDTLDRRLAGLARRFGLHYSRYADDITFSSMHHVYQPDGAFRRELERIITGQGFVINQSKTRLQKRGARQEVTGIIVSDKLNVSQHYVRDLRNLLYIWERYGYDTACSRFYPKYQADKGHLKKGMPQMPNIIEGKLLYLKMVKGESDSVYLRLKAQFDRLTGQLRDTRNMTHSIAYLETTPLLEFEQKNHTLVEILHSTPQEQTDSAATSSHRYATFTLGGHKVLASVNKVLTPHEEQHKEALAISHCLSPEGQHFWLIHRQNKVTHHPAPPVDLDQLTQDLADLLSE